MGTRLGSQPGTAHPKRPQFNLKTLSQTWKILWLTWPIGTAALVDFGGVAFAFFSAVESRLFYSSFPYVVSNTTSHIASRFSPLIPFAVLFADFVTALPTTFGAGTVETHTNLVAYCLESGSILSFESKKFAHLTSCCIPLKRCILEVLRLL